MHKYAFDGGSLYIYRDNQIITELFDQKITFLVDRVSEDMVVLHKHGNLENVKNYYDTVRQKSLEHGTTCLIENMSIVTIKITPEMVEEVNHCIETSGYFPRMCKKFGISFEDLIKESETNCVANF